MDDLRVTVKPECSVTSTLVLRSWSAEDASGAFEISGDPRVASTEVVQEFRW